MPKNPILDSLQEKVQSFKDTMPVVVALRNLTIIAPDDNYYWDSIF